MKKPEAVLKILEKYTPAVDREISELLSSQDDHEMYRMMEYFFGYRDKNFKKTKDYAGKRFRPGICLLISDFYGDIEKAIPVASSIEIFHNFTLIHDDIEDKDPLRRGKETVWKLWGVDQAINTGDAQFALCYLELNKYLKKYPQNSYKVFDFLFKSYLKVAEGQFMDLKMSEEKIGSDYVNVENYMKMISLKSATLVAASSMAAGIVADKDEKECQNLWDYGFNLGLAYQLSDDLVSIWGKAENTGKVESKDIEERKKTLPIIYLYEKLSPKDKKEFSKIYDKDSPLSNDEISKIKLMLSEKEAHDYVWGKMREKIEASNEAINNLKIRKNEKEILLTLNKALIPNIKWWNS